VKTFLAVPPVPLACSCIWAVRFPPHMALTPPDTYLTVQFFFVRSFAKCLLSPFASGVQIQPIYTFSAFPCVLCSFSVNFIFGFPLLFRFPGLVFLILFHRHLGMVLPSPRPVGRIFPSLFVKYLCRLAGTVPELGAVAFNLSLVSLRDSFGWTQKLAFSSPFSSSQRNTKPARVPPFGVDFPMISCPPSSRIVALAFYV